MFIPGSYLWPRARPQCKAHKEKHPHEHSICRVSQINDRAYCLDIHTRELLKIGVKVEKHLCRAD